MLNLKAPYKTLSMYTRTIASNTRNFITDRQKDRKELLQNTAILQKRLENSFSMALQQCLLFSPNKVNITIDIACR